MRNILFIIVLFISVKGYSQDIIITKEGKSIKAKIIELTEEKISYKKYEYQEGATIVLSIENIRRIVWQTGEIEDFNVNEHSEKEKIEKEEEKITEAITNPELLPHIMRHRIQRVIFNDGRYYYLSEFLVYLNMHELQDIGMQYFDGVKLSQTGIGLLIGGTVATLGGGMLINLFPRSLSFVNLIMGSILVTVGGSLVIASIPCLIIGNVKRNAAINKYNGNSKVQYTYQPNIYLGLTGNGFTVNLNF